MIFATPIYLLLLLPWAGVVAWVLFGRAEFARVSTTMFWEKTDTSTTTRRGLRKPPLWAVLMLLAMLAAILAAGGLGVEGGRPRVVWVVDRNLMTITDLTRDADLQAMIDASAVVPVPETRGRFTQPTTLDTRAAVEQAVQRLLRESDLPLVVVTSQDLRFGDARVTVMHPKSRTPNAGIDHFAVVTRPRPQAMVRVYNGTDAQRALLRVGDASQTIELPPAGQTKDFFVDIVSPGDVIEAVLETGDLLKTDNRAWLVREGATPRLATSPGLGEPVRRFVAVYGQHAAPAADAATVAITDDADAPSPAVIVRAGASTVVGEVRAADHPVNRWIDWTAVAPLVRDVVAEVPPRGEPVVWLGDRPIVAAGEGRVEIGFDVSKLASGAELVMLLTNAIEFASGGRSEYTAVAPAVLGAGWRRVDAGAGETIEHPPGVYTDGTNKRAVNVRAWRPALTPPPSNPPLPDGGREVVRLGGALLIVSLGMVLWGVFCLTPKGRRVR